jgi:hypothetical protein
LETLAGILDQKFDDLKNYDLPELVNVIRRNLTKELDFSIELRNMKIARSYASETEVYIPKAFEEYSSKKVLVMEFVQGARFKDVVYRCDHHGVINDHYNRHWTLLIRLPRFGGDRLSAVRCFGVMADHYHIAYQEVLKSSLTTSIERR